MKELLKKRAIPIGLGLLLLLAFLLHASQAVDIRLIQQLEAISYDARLRLFMPKTQDRRIAIIDIDEKSLAEEGRWPWGRDRLGVLLDKLFERHHVAAVGFDVVFAERDESSGLKVLDRLRQQELKSVPQFQAALEQLRPQLDHDRLFAEKLKNRPVALGYYFTSNDQRMSGMLPAPTLPAEAFKGARVDFIRAAGYGANLPELQRNAHSAGHFNPQPDPDGVTRRVPMLMEFQGGYYESLTLAMMRILLGDSKLEALLENAAGNGGGALEWLKVARLRIPVDENACAYIPYRGYQGSFRYIPAADIMHDRIAPAELEGVIVLVGTTAPGLMDLRSTPVGPVYPGVEIHANLLAGMLDNAIMQKPGYTLGAEVALLLLMGVVLAIALPLLSPLKGSLVSLAALAIAAGLNLAVWQGGQILPIAAILLLIVALFVLNMSYGFFVEARAKRQITGLFGQYVPPELVDEMSENPENFTMEGESREMTVLFSDVRGFTTISEGLDPKELSKLMNDYMTPMTRIIHHQRGTIDKYIGDAIMAFWGAPLRDPDHARHAVLAALEMQAVLARLRPQFIARGWPEIRIGVGVNSGVMSVGNMGSEFRMAYTVMGDSVNLGSRLEGITKQYGVGIIVGETTREKVPEILFRELDRVRVKGKDEPVAIYEPLGLPDQVGEAAKNQLARFEEALRFYRAQNWDSAEAELAALQKADPDCLLYRLYLERIAHFRGEPPPADWDGVFVFHTK